MENFFVILVAALAICALAFCGLGIKMLVRKRGEFKRHCASMDPYTGEAGGCVCGHLKTCEKAHKYQPLEVNQNLLDEC